MSSAGTAVISLEDIEIGLLLEGLYRAHGYDFRDYSRASIKRRILELVRAEKLETISAFQDKVLHDAACLDRFLLGLSVHATAMSGPTCSQRPLSSSNYQANLKRCPGLSPL